MKDLEVIRVPGILVTFFTISEKFESLSLHRKIIMFLIPFACIDESWPLSNRARFSQDTYSNTTLLDNSKDMDKCFPIEYAAFSFDSGSISTCQYPLFNLK